MKITNSAESSSIVSSDIENENGAQEQLVVELKTVTYFQKPIIGASRSDPNSEPIQLVYPSGNFGVGVSISSRAQDLNIQRAGIVAITSSPENDTSDRIYRYSVIFLFIVIGTVNLIISFYLYFTASTIDLSKVEKFEGNMFTFGRLAIERSPIENISFACTITIILIGMISAILQSPLGVSAFCYAIVVNFILGTQSLPYFFYCVRYIFDLFLLYVALTLRTKFTPSFLPVHVHGQ